MATDYDFVIDCAQDFTPQIDIERQNASTGDYEAYTPLSGITMLLSADRGSSTPIHASLSTSGSERTGTAGRLYCTFDVADLQTYLLPTYKNREVWLNVYKSGEIQYEPFRCRVVQDRRVA